MALQTDDLMMIGLGVQGDQPQNAMHQRLADGIHLRWAFRPELGFPWYGFHLFRRPHRAAQRVCINTQLQAKNLQPGIHSADYLYFGSQSISSNINLGLTDNFAPSGLVEIDLNRGSYVEFMVSDDNPIWSVELTIGFRAQGTINVEAFYRNMPVAVAQTSGSAGSIAQVTLSADRISRVRMSKGPASLINVCYESVRDAVGGGGWEPVPGFHYPLTLPVTDPSYPPTQGQDPQFGGDKEEAGDREPGNGQQCDPASIERGGTVAVTQGSPVLVGSGTAWTDSLVGWTVQVSGDRGAYVVLAVLGPDRLLLSRPFRGPTNGRRSYVIKDDPFGQLYDHLVTLVAGGPGSGVMYNRPYPEGLDFAGSVSVTPRSTRVLGSGTSWDTNMVGMAFQAALPAAGTVTPKYNACEVFGTNTSWDASLEGAVFQLDGDDGLYIVERVELPTLLTLNRKYVGPDLTDAGYTLFDHSSYTIAAVTSTAELHLDRAYDGAAGSGRDYRVVAKWKPQSGDPDMPELYPLDMVLLASIDPRMARTLGLYWIDRQVSPSQAYDYLLVADYGGAAELSGSKALDLVRQRAWSAAWMEYAVVFNKRMAPQAPLSAPNGLEAYALPGATPNPAAGVFACNNVGLRWDLGLSEEGLLLSGRPVLYHLWRASLGRAQPSQQPTNSSYQVLTADEPLMVAEPVYQAGDDPERPGDWPPFRLHAFDAGLVDGWYSYKLSAIDIFGRHSPNSAPAPWLQWSPVPSPRPWYFLTNPGTPPVVHSYALELRDMIPPPLPAAVEAFALDPDDPTVVKDAAYTSWRGSHRLVGVRVRWRWTTRHMRQAPDTREFRIYYHGGAQAPSGQRSAASWEQRLAVVQYSDSARYTSDAEGNRTYEIFLPTATSGTGLPLNPTLAQPLAYAWIGVSAVDDKTYVSGAGNEGPVGGPARIVRVRRERPSPPVVPEDGENVYATKADYYGRSFYTFRWTPQDYLKVHVYRALDDTLFQVDFAQQPRAALSASTAGIFPSESRWDSAKRGQVAAELNQLRTFGGDKTAAMAYYRGLSNDGLRVLAGLEGNQRAFSLITTEPLDGDALTDTLDGRSANRYLYRTAFVDGAHNRSEQLSLAGTPVWLPDVVPPRTPVVIRATGGRGQITLAWTPNREPDLASYTIYRSYEEANAQDIRLMHSVHTMAAPSSIPSNGEITWSDMATSGRSAYYRIVAVDADGNGSAPSRVLSGQAYDHTPPMPPAWGPAVSNADGSVTLNWADAPELSVLVERCELVGPWRVLSNWLPVGTISYIDASRAPATIYRYRLRVQNRAGVLNVTYSELEV